MRNRVRSGKQIVTFFNRNIYSFRKKFQLFRFIKKRQYLRIKHRTEAPQGVLLWVCDISCLLTFCSISISVKLFFDKKTWMKFFFFYKIGIISNFSGKKSKKLCMVYWSILFFQKTLNPNTQWIDLNVYWPNNICSSEWMIVIEISCNYTTERRSSAQVDISKLCHLCHDFYLDVHLSRTECQLFTNTVLSVITTFFIFTTMMTGPPLVQD